MLKPRATNAKGGRVLSGSKSKSIRSGIEPVVLYWEQPPSASGSSRTPGVNVHFTPQSLEIRNSENWKDFTGRCSPSWGGIQPRVCKEWEKSMNEKCPGRRLGFGFQLQNPCLVKTNAVCKIQ